MAERYLPMAYSILKYGFTIQALKLTLSSLDYPEELPIIIPYHIPKMTAPFSKLSADDTWAQSPAPIS